MNTSQVSRRIAQGPRHNVALLPSLLLSAGKTTDVVTASLRAGGMPSQGDEIRNNRMKRQIHAGRPLR